MKKGIMKESARQIVALDWIFFGISVAMLIAGVFRIAVGLRVGVWLVLIGGYAAYSSLYIEKVGRRTGILFIVFGAVGLVWCIAYAIWLLRLESAAWVLLAVSGWLILGMVCLPMGIYFTKRAKKMRNRKR
jgi:hypothetical protein